MIYENNTPIENRIAEVSIYYPNMSLYIKNNMQEKGDGVYYYEFTVPSVVGDYLVVVKCSEGVGTSLFRVYTYNISLYNYPIVKGSGEYIYYRGDIVKLPFMIIGREGYLSDYTKINITIRDPSFNIIAQYTNSTKITTGIYYITYNLSSNADYGLYTTQIVAEVEEKNIAGLSTFKVIPSGPLDISITPQKEKVQQGEDLQIKINIKNLGEAQTITYRYKLYVDKNTLYSETNSLSLSRYEDKELLKTIPLPLNADTGIGTLELKVTYDISEPSIYSTNFVTISASPKGKPPTIVKITLNLTPDTQYLIITDKYNNTVFKGIVHNKDKIELAVDKYTLYFTKEGYASGKITTQIDRDLVITSTLNGQLFQTIIATNWYKIILFLSIIAVGLIVYKFVKF